MTDFTLSAGDYMRPHRCPWGAFPIRNMKLSTGISSLAITVGQVVGLDVNSTSFQDCIVPSSLSSNAVVSTAIVGVAAQASTSPSVINNIAQGTLFPVWEAHPMCEFKARTGHGLLNSTMVGQCKGLFWDSTNLITLVECGASSLASPTNRVVVTGLIDSPGDSGGMVTCRFITHDPGSSQSTGRLTAFYV